jgi:hypothetical protein
LISSKVWNNYKTNKLLCILLFIIDGEPHDELSVVRLVVVELPNKGPVPPKTYFVVVVAVVDVLDVPLLSNHHLNILPQAVFHDVDSNSRPVGVPVDVC